MSVRFARRSIALLTVAIGACAPPVSAHPDASSTDAPPSDVSARIDGPAPDDATLADTTVPDLVAPRVDVVDAGPIGVDAPGLDAQDAGPSGPHVDRTSPQLRTFDFHANDADPAARQALGLQRGALDTRVTPRGQLVVFLHGAGAPTNCAATEHVRILTTMGFHVFAPCYVSDYGVGACGSDIGGCRLEAFEGVDHTPVITITPPDSIETRVVRGLQLLQRRDPGGDWQYYLDGTRPRWSAIVISGISHGASTSGLIGVVRPAARVVMLSGPLDTGQAWLRQRPLATPIAEFYGFTHTIDPQHAGHLLAFTDLGLPGAPTSVDGATAPYGASHQLMTSAATTDGHGSTQAGGASPRDAMGNYVFLPVWRTMYTAM